MSFPFLMVSPIQVLCFLLPETSGKTVMKGLGDITNINKRQTKEKTK